MRKLLLLALVAFVAVTGVAIAGDYETSDPTIKKYMWYGETAAGDPVKIQCEADGTVVTSGSSSGGDGVFTVVDGGLQLDTTYSGYDMTIQNDLTVGGDQIVEGTLSVDGDGTGSITISGSGEGVITMDDSDSVAHDLTIGAGAGLFIDGDELSSGATPGGTDTQVQFNDGGSALGGDAGLVYNKTSNDLTVANKVIVEGNPNLNFTDVETYAEVQVDGTLVMQLTDSGVIFAQDVQDYAYLTLSSDDSTNINNGNAPAFVENISNMEISGNDITLSSGKLYRISCEIRGEFSGVGYINLQFYSTTNSAYIGQPNNSFTTTWTSQDNVCQVVDFLYSPSADEVIELRIIAEQALTSMRATYSKIIIQQIA